MERRQAEITLRIDLSSARAAQRLIESPNSSNYLFLGNSKRKTAAHFSWNCSSFSAGRLALFGWSGARDLQPSPQHSSSS
ncbi:hypothetical protein EN827_11675 [Mesorhizobium sp. M1D.F.Ca.ET.184.01.1.1]|nr:hypothetical protein EN874_010415 [Mesorhizobium sp. M1D.F.Ca.ET.231.01.1.1]TGP35309.1 hypothetical protein EN877_11680 [Mesorhizobium sp. M1D.F.Ca.ET.234.01.1.1]TGS49331.1 hypothetical protein EN827_11675 [Mesorhizobium sp. M1D.F.Ca.ET.184.01.1.1]TGS63529.1 hypothetical protein EN826_011675 [Mesorhizobium sp. M1D.F.Ca.ET.183.01.1.1]